MTAQNVSQVSWNVSNVCFVKCDVPMKNQRRTWLSKRQKFWEIETVSYSIIAHTFFYLRLNFAGHSNSSIEIFPSPTFTCFKSITDHTHCLDRASCSFPFYSPHNALMNSYFLLFAMLVEITWVEDITELQPRYPTCRKLRNKLYFERRCFAATTSFPPVVHVVAPKVSS